MIKGLYGDSTGFGVFALCLNQVEWVIRESEMERKVEQWIETRELYGPGFSFWLAEPSKINETLLGKRNNQKEEKQSLSIGARRSRFRAQGQRYTFRLVGFRA